jgi:TorA maturation chaperone TorD
MRAVPALATHIDETPDPDQWAAAHHTALALEVPPFQSAFLSESGHLDDGAHLSQAYAQGGFGGARSDVPADHAGTSLHFLSWLCAAEADALRDGQEQAHTEVQALACRFIDTHLGRWLPALAVAMQTSPGIHPFFTEVALLSAELVSDHRATMQNPAPQWHLPEVPDPLSNPQTRLADLAQHLTTPSLAGGVLSRSALALVGRSTAVPKGFGSRALMLTNLMRTAAELGELPQVLKGISAVVEGWAHAHTAIGAQVWAQRARQTLDLLQRMAQAIELKE